MNEILFIFFLLINFNYKIVDMCVVEWGCVCMYVYWILVFEVLKFRGKDDFCMCS